MIPFFLPLAVCALKRYHAFTVTPDRPFSIRLQKSMLVLTLAHPPPDSVVLTVSDRANRTHALPLGQHSHIAFFKTSVFATISSGSFTLEFWLIPASLCGSVSYSATADYRLLFEVRSNYLPADFCIFSQSSVAHRVYLTYRSDGTNNTAAFYAATDARPQICHASELCRFESNRAFFLRFSDVYEAGFEATISIVANRRTIEAAECGFRPVPVLIEPPMQLPLGDFSVPRVQCTSAAGDVLRVAVAGILATAASLALLAVLHLAGCIDVRAICRCSLEREHFDALRAHALADEEGVPEL
jgi:hypothetical protein